MESFTACIPRTVDIEKILKEHPPKENLKRDKLLYIIHLLCTIRTEDRRNMIGGEWILINATALKNVINDYKKYMDYLIDEVGLINCDEKFAPAGRSMGYKFSSINYIAVAYKLVELTDKTLLKALDKAWKQDNYGNDYVKKNLPYLYKWFNNKLKLSLPEGLELPYSSSKASKAINSGNYRLSVDKFGKRLHTPITRLSKDLRKYLNYDGQKLVEIDIQCSQPYLSIKLILDNLSKEHPNLLEQLASLFDNSDKIALIDQLSDYNGLGQFMHDVLLDDFYLVLKHAFESRYDWYVGNGERDAYKEVMFTVMYSQNGYRNPSKKLFTELYPSVDGFYRKIKLDGYKQLAKKLQQLESKLILRTICKEVNRENKNIPLFTIHDSILTTPEYVVLVKEITIKVLTNEIGLAPNIHVKEY